MMADTQQQHQASSLAGLQTVAQARAELESRLVGIHNDLQLTQTIGLLFVKRQEDLKNCFDQLQELRDLQAQEPDASSADSAATQALPPQLREQLAQMDKEFQEGQNGILGLKGLIDAQLPTIEIQPPQNDSTARPGSVLGPSALPSSTLPVQTTTRPRRHKPVVPSPPSINDPAFPDQILEELLTQVRYWTSQAEMKEKLNQEYDTKITEQERIIDALNKQRRIREENDERQKEDQWNLELLNQDLRAQNTELQQQLSRALHENSKIQKAFALASEQVEQLKDKEEKTAGQLELTKSRHEQDMMTMRKHTAGIQREKSDLMKKVEEINQTVQMQRQKLTKLATMEAIALAQEREEQEPESPVEAPIIIHAPPRIMSTEELVPTPVAAPSPEPKVASLARETSFAHQQSIISELQSKLSKEITEKEELMNDKEELLNEKEELVKLLADREETIETMRLEGPGFEPVLVQDSAESGAGEGSSSEEANVLHHQQSYDELEDQFQDRPRSFISMRPVSPLLAGGLFAELAQAKSNVDIKAPVETKDQEAMTEPIESWIHTIPGFVKEVPVAVAPVVVEPEVVVPAVVEPEVAVPVVVQPEAVPVAAAPAPIAVQTEVASTQTDAVEAAPVAVAAPVPVQTAHVAVETTPIEKVVVHDVAVNTDFPVPTVGVSPAVAAASVVAAASAATATTAVANASSDDTTSGESSSSVASTAPEKSTKTETKEKASEKQRNGLLADIITGKSGAETKAISVLDSSIATPTVAGLEVASVRLPEILDQVQEIAQLKPAEEAFVEPFTPQESTPPKETQVLKALALDEPIPRFVNSETALAVDDERRHTCDMSQSILEDTQSVPPVPALPKDLESVGYQSQRQSAATDLEDEDFRVSFGSAFGNAGGSAKDTGRIEPIYPNQQQQQQQQQRQPQQRQQKVASPRSELVSIVGHPMSDKEDESYENIQSTEQQALPQGVLSPGRPTTGPPSTLLARAAARASMANELADNASLNESLMNNNNNDITTTNNTNTHTARNNNTDTESIRHHQQQTLNKGSLQGSPSSMYPRASSLRNEPRMTSSSPPSSSNARPMDAGQAFISGTTRTAYTFNQNSSQVHVPPTSGGAQYQLITDSSGQSIGRKYRPSPNGSISSMSTDYGGHHERRMSASSQYDVTSTDPTMIQVITQTMIGDYLWKYTRRTNMLMSEKRHRRYFWVHPYTKTMYWSLNNPAAEGSREQRAKSALIVAVFQITDENISSNSEMPNVSLLVQTSSRNLKLTAPTREKHELWYQSLAYLLSRPSTPGADIPSDNQTWSEVQATRGVASDTRLTIRNEALSVRKKGSFNRLQNIFGRSKEASPVGSPRSIGGGAQGATGSGLSSSSFNYASQSQGPPLSGGSGSSQYRGQHGHAAGGVTTGQAPSVVGYPSHMVHAAPAVVGGYGTVNGGPIMSQTSSFGTGSPKSRLGVESEDEEDEEEEEDEDDGVLPEHVRQCCDGKHDIGSLDHHHHH